MLFYDESHAPIPIKMQPFPDVATAKVFPLPEGTHLELKEGCCVYQFRKLMETVCGFLNSGGGYLVIGVCDDLTICGIKNVKDLDKFLLHIDTIYYQTAICAVDMTPVPFGAITAKTIPTGAGNICVITVTRSEEKLYQMKDGNIVYRLAASNVNSYIGQRIAQECTVEQVRSAEREKANKERSVMTANLIHLTQSNIELSLSQEKLTLSMEKCTEALMDTVKLLHETILHQKVAKEMEITREKRGWFCLW